MECRKGCGACCIAPSITQSYYQMPHGKKTGERCVHLDNDNACLLFGSEHRPKFCQDFLAELFICGNSFEEAMRTITELDIQTQIA